MSEAIKELTAEEITPEEFASMQRTEELIDLRKGVVHDRESTKELIEEVIEQRREQYVNLDINIEGLEACVDAVRIAYNDLEAAILKAQITTARTLQN